MAVGPMQRAPVAGCGGGSRAVLRRALGRDWAVALFFLAPLLLLLFGLIGYPLVQAVRLSLLDTVGLGRRGFVGLENYGRLWSSASFREMLWLTARFAGLSLVGQGLLGMVAALLIQRAGPGRRGLLTGLYLLPWITPEVVVALTWRGLFDPINGGLNHLLALVGVRQPIVWLDFRLAFPIVILINIWRGAPFFALLLLAGLDGLDPALHDAAAVDGANAWQRFRHVTLPGLRHVLGVASLLSLLFSLNAYTLVAVMTNGGPLGATRIFPLVIAGYARGRGAGIGAAAALSVAPFLLLVIALLSRALREERTDERPGASGWAGTRAWMRLVALLAPPLRLVVGLPLVALDALVDWLDRAWRGLAARLATRQPARGLWIDVIADGTISALTLLLLVGALAPLAWIVLTAFKTTTQISTARSLFWPDPWTLEQFVAVLTKLAFPAWFVNSAQVALVSTLVSVVAGALGAYALARLRFRGAGLLATLVLGTALVPSILFLIPLYLLLVQLGVINTPRALMLAYPSFGMPMACWLLLGYFRSLPAEIEEAALIDGCTHWQVWRRIVLPLSRPALVAVALFTLTLAWNELAMAATLTWKEAAWTLPVGLSTLVLGDIFPYGRMFAASLLMSLPVLLCALLGQRALVAGLTAGAAKG